MTENLDSPCLAQIQQLRKAQNKTLEMYRELYESYIESPNKSYDRSASKLLLLFRPVQIGVMPREQ